MCANPAVSTDNHAASYNCARSDPTARTDLCSCLNHSQRSDLRRRIDERPLRHNCGRGEYLETPVAPDRTVRQRVPKQRMVRSLRSPLLPLALAPPYQDARSQRRPTSDPVRKRNVYCQENLHHSGQPFAEGPHLRGAARVHHNPACRPRNNCKWIRPTSAKEPRVARSCFDHLGSPQRTSSTSVYF